MCFQRRACFITCRKQHVIQFMIQFTSWIKGNLSTSWKEKGGMAMNVYFCWESRRAYNNVVMIRVMISSSLLSPSSFPAPDHTLFAHFEIFLKTSNLIDTPTQRCHVLQSVSSYRFWSSIENARRLKHESEHLRKGWSIQSVTPPARVSKTVCGE